MDTIDKVEAFCSPHLGRCLVFLSSKFGRTFMKAAAHLLSMIFVLFASAEIIAEPANFAASYPVKAVRVIVPFPAGGMDVIARVVADRLSESLNASFHVENIPGAGGTIGTGVASMAPADGSTVLVMNQDFVIQPLVKRTVPYDVFKSFTPVSLMATAPEMILINPSVPAKNMQQLIALLKENPRKYSYATPGHGTSPHLASERLFRLSFGLDIVHVPFQGAAPAIMSTIAGHTHVIHITVPLVAQYISNGTLRPLAIASDKRSAAFPDVPTLAEAGVPNREVAFWMGAMVPAKTPNDIVEILRQEIAKIEGLPVMRERLSSLGFEPIATNAPSQFANHIQSQFSEWSEVVRDAHLKID
jgi:tripartite-type tricarboxylate transporter receptor subunit TctC